MQNNKSRYKLKKLIDKVFDAGHYNLLYQNHCHYIYTISKQLLIKKINQANIKTPTKSTLYTKCTWFIDYFHRVNPKNDWFNIPIQVLDSLLTNNHYAKIIMDFLVSSKILLKQAEFLGYADKISKVGNRYQCPYYKYYYKLNTNDFSFYGRPISYFTHIFNKDTKIQKALSKYINEITNLSNDFEDTARRTAVEKLSQVYGEANASEYVDAANQSLKALKIDISEKDLSKIKGGKNELKKFTDYQKCITSVDRNYRIYNPITNMSRKLRKHLNYSWSVDIHNSHPFHLLLLLREYFGYGNIKRYINYFCGDKPFYGQMLDGMADSSLPKDVILFSELCQDTETSKRTNLWTYLTNEYINLLNDELSSIQAKREKLNRPHLKSRRYKTIKRELGLSKTDLRSDIKKKTFKYVFYETRGAYYENQPIVQIFERLFPNVLTAILNMRKEINYYCERNSLYTMTLKKNKFIKKYNENLATFLMKIESRFMFNAVLVLYHKFGASFFTIHDAIYHVGDANPDWWKTYAEKVLINQYKNYDLKPKFGEETSKYDFSKDKVNNTMIDDVKDNNQPRMGVTAEELFYETNGYYENPKQVNQFANARLITDVNEAIRIFEEANPDYVFEGDEPTTSSAYEDWKPQNITIDLICAN